MPVCSSETVFGIYDAEPAILVFDNSDDWHAWVDNKSAKAITHIAVDKCLDIPQSEGKRCESILTYEKVIIFLELKDRNTTGWFAEALKQIANTIILYSKDGDLETYRKRLCHIANKQRPKFNTGKNLDAQKFVDETGFIVRSGLVIEID